ncbi:MAG TPA: DUF192 domain-containing protein [Myxococcota bacterium]|nr:DUF192 domain-containing protein [Myxococcota bacterium]
MRIKNQTKDKLLADKAGKARSTGDRMKGLLGRDGLEEGEGLYITPCTSIHSFFMRFVFDAIFVDKNGIVLHLIPRMKKWRMSKWVPRAAGVIELPAGTIEASGTQKGDRVVMEVV